MTAAMPSPPDPGELLTLPSLINRSSDGAFTGTPVVTVGIQRWTSQHPSRQTCPGPTPGPSTVSQYLLTLIRCPSKFCSLLTVQRKDYAASVHQILYTTQYRVEVFTAAPTATLTFFRSAPADLPPFALPQHLFTFELDGRQLRNVSDCVEQLQLLEEMGRVWGQSMMLVLQAPRLMLTDIETKVSLGQIIQINRLENHNGRVNLSVFLGGQRRGWGGGPGWRCSSCFGEGGFRCLLLLTFRNAPFVWHKIISAHAQ